MPLAWLSPCFQSLPPLPIASGALLVAALTLIPRVGEFVDVLAPWALYTNSPERPVVPSTTLTPTGLQPEVMRLYFPVTRTVGLAWGRDRSLHSCHSQFVSAVY